LFLQLLRSETATSPERRRAALAGLRAYQQAERAPGPPEKPIVAQIGRASLRDYGGDGPPVVFVPSLINPPYVLDLGEHVSLLRWLSGAGVRPLLLDWGAPRPEERDLDIAGHVETLLLPLLDALGERTALAGYCIGGTMAIAAAARRPVSGLALIAAPWHFFSGFPQAARDNLMALWEQARPAAEPMGVLPMEVLQTSFWRLDPARTNAKFAEFAGMEGEAAAACVALEDWANDGPPLSLGAGHELLCDFFGSDLPGRGEWQVGGRPVDIGELDCPILDIVSTTDRIVPAATAAGIGTGLKLDLGHVGMIVGSRGRAALWEPLGRWLSQLQYK
jgi:polyhydroxyalkanoate synthase